MAPYSAALNDPDNATDDELDDGDAAEDDAADGSESATDAASGEAGTESAEGPRKRRRRRRRRKRRTDEATTAANGEAPTAEGAATQGAAAEGATAAGNDAPRTDAPRTDGSRNDASRNNAPRNDAARSDARGGQPRGEPRRDRRPDAAPRNDASSNAARHEPRAPRPPSRDAAAFASLTAGLFSHLDDRAVQCKVDGCTRTWMWTAAEQIESFGQPPPRRMCAEHLAATNTAADLQIGCSNPWCERTWTWTRSAQLAAVQRSGPRRPDGEPQAPSRVCDHCIREEKELPDAEVACRVDGCTGTWTWARDAQLKHRAWLRHQPAQPRHESVGEGGRGRRRRRGRSQSNDGPPPRMCESCRQRMAALVDRETLCKVHGCTRQVKIDRESQLRAWVAAGDRNLAEVALPKRMCEVCREFCRLHRDREVACARPDCTGTWTYKSGAQLQAFLAGHFEDPARLCAECVASGHAQKQSAALSGIETMPCVVPLCDGIWHYAVGMTIAPCNDGDQPLDRMCNDCRTQRGASPRAVPQPIELSHEELADDLADRDPEGGDDESNPSDGTVDDADRSSADAAGDRSADRPSDGDAGGSVAGDGEADDHRDGGNVDPEISPSV